MEKLNEYLQTLMSTCSYELHLEPNKVPYIVSANGSTDVSNSPLLGTQISTLVFPLIPNAVKMELPNKNEIEFVHTHNLGNFNFQVRKSPAGFNVTIRPVIAENASSEESCIELLQVEPDIFSQPAPVASFSNEINQTPPETENYSIESSSIVYENETSEIQASYQALELEVEDAPADAQAENFSSLPPVETVSFNDPDFQTVFSDTATYEPPGRRDDFDFQANEYAAPQNDFVEQSEPAYQPQPEYQQPQYQQQQFVQPPVQQFYAPPESSFAPAQANPQARARMDALFQKMAAAGASDLHMSVSMSPMMRKDGKMQKLECSEGMLAAEAMRELLTSIMPSKNQE